MRPTRRPFIVAVIAAAGLTMGAGVARAQAPNTTEEARAYADKATAAYALTHYAAAAENFEKAFELRSDPALLYNAAQAHRLAGNKQRALELYRSYLRLYAKKEKRAEIEARIAELEAAIARDGAIAKPPNGTEPVAPAPVPGPTPAPGPTPPPAPEAAQPRSATLPVALEPVPAAAPTLVAQPAPAAREESLVQKPWFWIATGAGVAAAVTVVLLLTLGGNSDPSPSIGRISAN